MADVTPGPAPAPLLASIGDRCIARVIDSLLLGLPTVLLTFVVLKDAHPSIKSVLVSTIFGVYEIGMLSRNGQTIGKAKRGIRVVGPDGLIPSPERAAKRFALPWALGLIPFIGWALANMAMLRAAAAPDRRGFHDLVADTWVVSDGATAAEWKRFIRDTQE
jgi:uncharacterized RDD family membrane protein YckC